MTTQTLLARFRGVVCDLDGVVYAGPRAIPHAVAALARTRAGGRAVVYATNNASRTPDDVADHLTELGLEVAADEVITSATAGAHLLAEGLAEGSPVLAVGGPGVPAALRAVGLDPGDAQGGSEVNPPSPRAVLQGYGPDVRAADLARVAHAVQRGARWVATNTDRTLPTQSGVAPGNGTLVAAVRAAVDHDPEVVGKPGPAMYAMAVESLGAAPELVLGIGDRLETDIVGAHAAGLPAALVLTGVHGMLDLVRAQPNERPEYVIADLRALHEPYAAATDDGDRGADCAGQTVRLESASGPSGVGWALHASGGAPDDMSVPRMRAALRVLWRAIDAGDISPDDAVGLWRSSVG